MTVTTTILHDDAEQQVVEDYDDIAQTRTQRTIYKQGKAKAKQDMEFDAVRNIDALEAAVAIWDKLTPPQKDKVSQTAIALCAELARAILDKPAEE